MCKMEERIEISLLMDIYGELLTTKQKDIMNLYFNEDLSFGEIGLDVSTSRQAIQDMVKRTSKQLCEYEKKLKILENRNLKEMKKEDLKRKLKENIKENKIINIEEIILEIDKI